MVVKAPARTYTPEDLLTMPDGDHYELVDGQLVERVVGMESSYIGGRVFGKLLQHEESTGAGQAFPSNAGFQCFPNDPGKVRRANAAFVKAGWFSPNVILNGLCRVVPDVVAEVISPNDRAYDFDAKIQDWFDAGVSLVWVVNPHARMVRVCRANGSGIRLRENDELTGDILPGIRFRVGSLFEGVGPPSQAAAEH